MDDKIIFSERISVMSTICSFLVVLIHLQRPGGEWANRLFWIVNCGIASIAVPFFFLVSGFFLANRLGTPALYKEAVIKRVHSLVLPFFLWNLLFLGYDFFMQFLSNIALQRSVFNNCSKPFSFWASAFGLNVFRGPILGPLWYIRSLFIFVLISPLIIVALKRLGVIVIVFLFLLCMVFGPCSHGIVGEANTFVYFFVSPEGILWFAIGLYLSLQGWRGEGVIGRRKAILLFTLGIAILICRQFVMERGYSWRWISPFATTVLLISSWELMPRKMPMWMKGLSFPIYVLHMFFIVAFNFTMKALNASKLLEPIYIYLQFCFVIVTTVVAAKVIRKTKFRQLLFGNR